MKQGKLMKNVLSLFNGISGCHLALDKSGIEVGQVYYAEIDKYANQITEKHYPNDIALGNVLNWREWNIDWSSIELVGAGFPCQAWSVAGKQLGDKDERGMLFWTTLDIIANVLKHNPSAKFLMENVKMKKDFEQYITHHTEQALGRVEKTLINSALVSAQNRQRYYWTNFEVTQPEDKGILLKDIIEHEPDVKYAVNQNVLPKYTDENGNVKGFRDSDQKSKTLIASMHKGFGNDGCTVLKQDIHNGCDISYRKLTPLECERLQTFPDNWTDCVSNTQRYKSLGNAWTVDVIVHIFKCMTGRK